ncbi:hypothetical protein LAB1_17950 [Roseibium sp. LAB1]
MLPAKNLFVLIALKSLAVKPSIDKTPAGSRSREPDVGVEALAVVLRLPAETTLSSNV